MIIKNLNRIILLSVVFIFSSTMLMAKSIKKEKMNPPFTLPALPYAANALEPVISEQTMLLHHGKHLQTYINNLNKLIAGTPWEQADLETIILRSDGPTFNNAAQMLNHIIYFNTFSPQGNRMPSDELADAINKKWGSFDKFKEAFETAGGAVFGSGWVWLAQAPDGSLEIIQKGNAGNPITEGYTPLLGADVWEHAYYLDYQNKRADHLKKLWEIIDWNVVGSRYKK